jgi:short-subunit dehydrogenase
MERSGMGASKLIKGRTLPTAKQVAEYGYAAMQKGKPVAIPGLGNYLMSVLPGISPRKLTTAVVGLLQAKPKN